MFLHLLIRMRRRFNGLQKAHRPGSFPKEYEIIIYMRDELFTQYKVKSVLKTLKLIFSVCGRVSKSLSRSDAISKETPFCPKKIMTWKLLIKFQIAHTSRRFFDMHIVMKSINPIWTGGGGAKCPPEGFC